MIPKPSRATYPCQQAAFPIASAFIIAIAGSIGSAIAWIQLRKKTIVALASTGLALIGLIAFTVEAQSRPATAPGEWKPITAPNSPIGDAKGIFPGRVTWIRDLRATQWDGKTGKWWDEKNIDQAVLDGMLSRTLLALTGAASESQAWDKLFHSYNATHGRGDKGYDPAESIAVKVNLNNATSARDVDNDVDASPQSIRALLRQMVNVATIPQKQIVIYDASRTMANRIYDALHKEFPEVRWMDRTGANGREGPQWVANAITYTSPQVALGNALPKDVVDASYLINMALLKGHEIAGITLCAKNHFGTIQYPSRAHNDVANQYAHLTGNYSAFVDLMGCPNSGGKTMLYLLDGLYGCYTNVGQVTERDRWQKLFNGEWSASLFASQDPVAIDSVGLDFLAAEWGWDLGFSGARQFPKGSIKNYDNYLREAALGVNEALGPYKSNGVALGSLGTFEHWNNAKDKQYSRNLSPAGKGIELFSVPAK